MIYDRAHAVNTAIRTVATRHRSRMAQALSALGLHIGHEVVLLTLEAKGPQNQRSLAAVSEIDASTMTVMLRKLETEGFVSRRPSPEDRRAHIVDLTDKARSVLPSLKKLYRDLAARTVADMSDEEVDSFIRLLGDAARNLNGRTAPL